MRWLIISSFLLIDTVGSLVFKFSNMILIESMMGLRPRQGNLRLVFRLFSLMRGLPISLLRTQPHHWLFFSPIIFIKHKGHSMLKLFFKPLLYTSNQFSPVNFIFCMFFLLDWQPIRNLQWHFLYITGCQFHILHAIYWRGNKCSCWN